MAAKETEENLSLSQKFDNLLQKYYEIEESTSPSSSPEYQAKVSDLIKELEKCTVFASELSLFSNNEVLEELPTSTIKFFLLPFLLGSLTLKSCDLPREKVLNIATIYFKDFLKRCIDYHLISLDLSKLCTDEKTTEKPSFTPSTMTPELLKEMEKQREKKLLQFKEKKALEDKIKRLREVVQKGNVDEETIREYYISLVKSFCIESETGLKYINMEINILKSRESQKAEDALKVAAFKSEVKVAIPEKRPLNSDEKYEAPWWNRECQKAKSNRNRAQRKSRKTGLHEDYVEWKRLKNEAQRLFRKTQEEWEGVPRRRKKEEETNKKGDSDANNDKSDSEDEESDERLAALREKDEWKDTHRTGWGNTHNRS